MKLGAKWQFWKNTHFPRSMALRIMASARGPWKHGIQRFVCMKKLTKRKSKDVCYTIGFARFSVTGEVKLYKTILKYSKTTQRKPLGTQKVFVLRSWCNRKINFLYYWSKMKKMCVFLSGCCSREMSFREVQLSMYIKIWRNSYLVYRIFFMKYQQFWQCKTLKINL